MPSKHRFHPNVAPFSANNDPALVPAIRAQPIRANCRGLHRQSQLGDEAFPSRQAILLDPEARGEVKDPVTAPITASCANRCCS